MQSLQQYSQRSSASQAGPVQGDYLSSLWLAYLNTVNALRIPMTMAENGAMITMPSIKLFEWSVDILSSMILDSLKDEQYKKKEGQGGDYAQFHEIVELFERKHVFKEKGVDLGHV